MADVYSEGINLTALRAELDADPKGLGYATKSDREVWEAMTTVGATDDTIEREVVPAWEIAEAVVRSEFRALDADDKEMLSMILSMGEVNLKGVNVRTSLAGMFTAGTDTRANLIALQTEPTSRVVALDMGPMREWHIARARAL